MHSDAAAPRIFAKRALHANTENWCLHGARVWQKCAAPQRWNASGFGVGGVGVGGIGGSGIGG
eukprot:11080095-Lingulodinium_polyedra.AAC.1